MPRPRGRSNPEITRNAILSAAARMFAADGYHASSLARIAGEVGITAPSLTYYFSTKQTLFDDVLRAAWSALADELRPILGEDTDSRAMFGRVLAVLVAAENRNASLTAITAVLLSGPDLGTRAINDTLLPLIDEVEAALRAASLGRMHAQAPLREVLTYIAVAHAAQHPLSQVAPTNATSIAGHESFIALALFDAVLSWDPDMQLTNTIPALGNRG